MILKNLFISFLSLFKWIIISSLKNILLILDHYKEGNKENRSIRVTSINIKNDGQDDDKETSIYCFKIFQFNVVKIENTKKNLCYLKFKLSLERFIMIIMLIKYFIAIIIHNNDYALYYGDITKDFGGLQIGFQLVIFFITLLSLIASYFFNEKPKYLKIIHLMKVYNGELKPNAISLYDTKQIKQFYKLCRVSQLIYDFTMYLNTPITSIFFIWFAVSVYSSYEMLIMLFWSLIWICWMTIIVDCLGRCSNWSVLTFFYILLLIEQLYDDINDRLYQSNKHNKFLDLRLRILIKRLNKICLTCKSLYHFWEKFLTLCFSIYFIGNVMFTYELIFGDKHKVFLVKFICGLASAITLFTFVLSFSLISFVSSKKQIISSAIRAFDSFKLNIRSRIKV